MTFLSDALRPYYNYRSNRIIFKSGLTLNQLAFLMWEKLGYREIDASVISRVISGSRLFTRRQLFLFCRLLHLSYIEKGRLKQTLVKDLLTRSGNSTRDAFFPVSEQHAVKIVHSLTSGGNPHYAIELASLFEDLITQKNLLARLYNEKSRAFGLISSPSAVLSLMSPLNDKALEIGEKTRDREILNMTYMNIGGGFYVGAKWQASADFINSIFKHVDKTTQVEFLRTLVLDYAYLQDKEGFRYAVTKSLHLLDVSNSLDSGVAVSLLEALARSFSLFGYFKEAKKFLNLSDSFHPQPFYYSQILRCKALVFYHQARSGKNIDKEEFLSILKEASSDKFLPYRRHQLQILKVAKKLGFRYGKN